MAGGFNAFYEGENLNSANHTLNELYECQNKYVQLVREYQPEINYIEQCLKELREEKKSFYEKELPEILNILGSDGVKEENREIWVEELRDSMERSFHMSQNLLQDLAIKQIDEFRRDAEKILRGGR